MSQQPALPVDDAVFVDPARATVPAPVPTPATGFEAPGRTASGGQVPPIAVVLCCLASVIGGVILDHKFFQTPASPPRIALVEQGAVVLDALLNRPQLDASTARRVVGGTVEAVVAKYQRAGYLVVNVNPAQDGGMVVEAVPKSAIDITEEVRAAVSGAVSGAITAGVPGNAASTAAASSLEPGQAN
jgi:hypothetical protein